MSVKKQNLRRVLNRLGWNAYRTDRWPRYHQSHAREAKAALTVCLSSGLSLSSNDKASCDSYAIEVLGNNVYAPWLYVYCAVAGGFKEGWIPDNYFGQFVVGRCNGAYGALADYRCITATLFKGLHNPDVAYMVGGRFFSRSMDVLLASDIASYLFSDNDSLVFKVDRSMQGRGVTFLSPETFVPERIAMLGDGVFQRRIQQHPLFDFFSAESVATLRLTTTVECDGAISLRAAYLRIGRAGHTHILSKDSVRAAIDLETGCLSTNGYLSTWSRVTRHPDSGYQFEGFIVPRFFECANLVKGLHRLLAPVGCIGWDLAVDAQGGVTLLEWNGGHTDIKFTESTQGPGFTGLEWENLWKVPAERS